MGEYWSARELYRLLGYSTWQKFQYAVEQAKKACEQSQEKVSDHFNFQVKMVKSTKSNGACSRDRKCRCLMVTYNND